MAEHLQVGEPAPLFEGLVPDEASLAPSDYRGRWVVLKEPVGGQE